MAAISSPPAALPLAGEGAGERVLCSGSVSVGKMRSFSIILLEATPHAGFVLPGARLFTGGRFALFQTKLPGALAFCGAFQAGWGGLGRRCWRVGDRLGIRGGPGTTIEGHQHRWRWREHARRFWDSFGH